MTESTRQVVVLLVLVLTVGQPALGRDSSILTPPYARSHSEQRCDGAGLSVCSAHASADKDTGAVRLDLRVTSPEGGTVPYFGDAGGKGRIEITYRLAKAVSALPISVHLRVNQADARHTGLLFRVNDGMVSGYAFSDGLSYATHSSCGSCSGHEFFNIVNAAQGPTTRSSEDITVSFSLVNEAGGLVPSGTVTIHVLVGGGGALEYGFFPYTIPDNGTASVELDATLKMVVVG